MTSLRPVPTLQFLGGAVVLAGGTPLGGPAAHRHRLALLALLAGSPSPISRDKLIALLWPERDEERGRNLLKVAVHELRKLIGEQAIRTTGDQLSLDSTVVGCDVTEFEAAIAAKDLEKAVGLYAGPFLDGFFMKDSAEFERWADGKRNQLASTYASAVEQLASSAEGRGDSKTAVAWWRTLAAHDPLRPDVAIGLMRALADSGDRDGAIRHAEIHAAFRAKDFGVDPEPSVAKFARELSAATTSSSIVVAAPVHTSTYSPNVARGSSLPGRTATEAPVARRRVLPRPVIMGAGIVAMAAIAVLVNGRRASKPPVARLARDAVAVLPFRVVGSDSSLSYLREGMVDLLVARFGSDGPVRAIDARAAARSKASADISLASAMDMARSAGAGEVLLGDVIGGGQGGVDLAVTIYRVPKGDVVARATRTVAKSEIAPAVDTLAAELMSRAAGEAEDRLADLARRPLPALRTYLAAQQSYRTGQYVRAESLFAKSLDFDSTFALAGMGLALANSWNTINEHYGIGRDAALRGAHSLGARDRAFLAAFFGPDPALGQPRPAPAYLQAWEDVVHKWPDFAEAWYHLGDRYYHFGGLSGLADPLDQARTAFRRAVAIDPTLVAPLHHLIEIYASRGEKDEARATGEQYFAVNPGVSRDASAIGWTLAMVLDDKAWLARVRGNFDKMPLSDLARIAWITQANGWPPDDADRALATYEKRAGATYEHESALALRYAFALNAGHLSLAKSAATAFEAQLPDQPIAALWSMYATLFGEADTTGAMENLRKLTPFALAPLSGNPDHQSRQLQAGCLIGYWNVRTGNIAEARVRLSEIQKRFASMPASVEFAARDGIMCAAWLAASVAVEDRETEAPRLVARLDTIVLRDRVPPRMSLTAAAIMSARLHEKLGRPDLALAATRWREHFTGDPVFLSTQLRLEGDLALRAGDRVGAARAYRHYLALRPSPDPGRASETTTSVRLQLADLDRR